ncbi:E3 ubiquitin-protein ligase TTC3 isoform X3 [Antechinus flavipes]|uniref:E3 ubiquitin-protein ligase TTC3 isoform X3 n=1 Tax=Antechinus flavipes TaxID=38775 RepID=UPI002235BBD3|nr:E3 ubiquitin-protein ligase TTC3 isoform X3 [Antechinus flavipes]
METSITEADLIGSSYVRITKLCCEQGGAYPAKYSQVKTNLELDICKIWCSKPLHVLRDYCDVIKIYIFWPLLFQREQTPVVSQLHPCIDVSSSTCELSLKRLQHIELLEDIVDLAKKVVDDQFFIGGILRIGYKIENKILAIEEAFNWVKYTGEFRVLRKLERAENCWPMLSIFFTEYKYHITKVVLEDCNLVEEFEYQNCAACIKEGEIMKTRGNEEFSEERFDTAITYYTRAIEFRPENHLLYSNRALCFLRTGQFKSALGDGKRATILKYNWPKGHYRFCDALSMLGEHSWALEANERAQHLCRNYPDGMKDLTQQNIKLQKQVEELRGSKHGSHQIRKSFYGKRLSSGYNSPKPLHYGFLNFMETNEENKVLKLASKYRDYYHYQNLKVSREIMKLENKDYPPDLPPGHNPKFKGKSKNKSDDVGKPSLQLNLQIDLQSLLDKQFSKSSRAVQQDFAILIKMLQSLIEEGCTALMDQHCRSAAKAFSRLLSDLDPNKLKQLNLALINYVLVIYGYAISLLGIGMPEELSEAEYQFKRIIEQYPNEGVDCLAYFGIGKVYLKKNRFSDALGHFQKSKTMIKLIPGVLTWPTTNVIIEESQAEKLQLILENHIEECKFPPDPDAVCCYQKCNGYSKIQIYLNDPDFKGFIRINCCQFCRIEFHISCWKKLKTTIFNDKNDKDFLQGTCLTPDCRGIISKIVIFGAAGHIKCEFEHRVTKERYPPRPVMKQKCSSLEKLKIKEEKKVKRKLQKKEAQKIAKERMEEKTRENNSSKHGDHKGFVQSCHLPDDRILLCIKQNAEQIKSGIQDASKLLRELLSWKVISTEDYADTYFNSGLLSEKMEHLIDHLVRKNNRVNTRIFLHVLSEIEEINPKLRDWIQKLNSLGLDATRTFFSRYGDSVKKLDFKFISMLWVEKYGHKLDHIISSYEERKIVEYSNNQGSLKEARYIIWLLEENREKFPALHNALDEFFDIMDGPCTILKKQETEDISSNGIKVKNKTRKKKHKESKPVIILSGVGGVSQNDDKVGTDESTLLHSNSYDPFVVPEYLRDEVEEFEALYEKNSSNNCNYQKLLDSNLDPKCEPLYDYFSQILEEHGPLEIDDKLLVGEYEHFPEEARKIVEEAGGLKSFLLDSLRFVMIDNYIGLMKDTVQLKKNKTTGTDVEESTSLDEKDSLIFSPRFQKNASQLKLQLNPAAKEFKPVTCNSFIPASKNKKTNRAAKYVTTGYVSYIPFNTVFSNQGFDTSNTSVSYANMLPQSSQCISLYTTVSDVSSDYPKKRKLPLVSAVPPMTDSDKRDNLDSANSEACNVNVERPMLEKVCSSGKSNCEKKMRQNTQKTTLKAEICKNNTAKDACIGNNDHCDLGTSKLEREMKNTAVIKNTPCIRMVAIQVKSDLMHQEVNTLPFGPFETQQGDILRMEKEHQVLQEQLKEAREKYEQLKCRSTEETREVEEKLKRTIEENKISKTELNWFHQDLEIEVKKWQQEKKENQEKLKTLRNKVKKLNDTHEIYSRNNEEKDQQYASHLDEFLKISNKFANEKLKMEELIKKGKENYQETIKRAVAAEVSILENWKTTDVSKLQNTASKAEMYVKNLKLMNSDSASSLNLESEINHWESFISEIKKEIEKAEFEFEDRIQKVKAGSQLDKLSKVKVPEFPLPTDNLFIQDKPADINDPASMTYSAQVHSDLFSEYDDQSPVIIPADLLTGSQALTLENTNLHSGNDCSEEITSVLLQASYTDPCQVTQPLPIVKSSEKDTQINQSSKGVSQTHASSPNQPQKKHFNNVIEHLATIFPNYSSVELLNFIQKVQNQDRTTHASLESDEIVRRVTELILDEQNKKLAVQGTDMSGAAESSDLRHSAENVSVSSSSIVPASETLASKPWVVVGGPSKSKWQKSNDSPVSNDDPCIICYEELNQEHVCEMDCGHQFHKWCIEQWLKEQSTCPTCREYVLLAEEFPALSGSGRPA